MFEDMLDGPIPGENYTSDTKNYPWHRPPEITDLDEGIRHSINLLTEDEDEMFKYMAYLDGGFSIVTTTDIFVTIGIADGKWTPDFALLLAGPVSRILEIMAKAYGIKVELGLEDSNPKPSAALIKAMREGTLLPAQEVREEVEQELGVAPEMDPMMSMGGLGAPVDMAPPDEQMAMLGYGPEEGMEDVINDEVL